MTSVGRLTRRRPGAGQSTVEFALVVPIVMLLLFTLIDFGRVVFAQNAITQGSREGVRVGVVEAQASAAKYTAIRNAALALSPGVALAASNITGSAPAGQACAAGSPDNFYPDGVNGGGRVVVNICVTVPLYTPIISNIVGGSITVTARSEGRIQ